MTDDPNQYKIGDGVHAWNELPLRGFDGTLVHQVGNSTTSVMSQKAVSDEFAKLRTAGYIYAGIATETTNPGTPVEKVFYVATTAGTYTNFGNKAVNNGITILSWNGTSWTSNELISIKSEVGSNENAVMSQKIVSNLLQGEADSITNNIRNPYTYLGSFKTWTEVQAKLDKLHNTGGESGAGMSDDTKIGEFRVLLDGRNLLVRNWVQNWATGVFTQTVEGSIKWNGETMEQSLQTNTYERTYNGGVGWSVWESASSSGGNMILDWKTDAATTRKQVTQDERKAGMMISYKNASGEWINEQYVGTSFDDTSWAADANWQQIGASAIELAQELSTEEGSENKAISQKAVSEAFTSLNAKINYIKNPKYVFKTQSVYQQNDLSYLNIDVNNLLVSYSGIHLSARSTGTLLIRRVRMDDANSAYYILEEIQSFEITSLGEQDVIFTNPITLRQKEGFLVSGILLTASYKYQNKFDLIYISGRQQPIWAGDYYPIMVENSDLYKIDNNLNELSNFVGALKEDFLYENAIKIAPVVFNTKADAGYVGGWNGFVSNANKTEKTLFVRGVRIKGKKKSSVLEVRKIKIDDSQEETQYISSETLDRIDISSYEDLVLNDIIFNKYIPLYKNEFLVVKGYDYVWSGISVSGVTLWNNNSPRVGAQIYLEEIYADANYVASCLYNYIEENGSLPRQNKKRYTRLIEDTEYIYKNVYFGGEWQILEDGIGTTFAGNRFFMQLENVSVLNLKGTGSFGYRVDNGEWQYITLNSQSFTQIDLTIPTYKKSIIEFITESGESYGSLYLYYKTFNKVTDIQCNEEGKITPVKPDCPIILFIGDSITSGWNADIHGAEAYPSVVADLLGCVSYVISRYGINSQQMLESIFTNFVDENRKSFYLRNQSPTYVAIALGTNDSEEVFEQYAPLLADECQKKFIGAKMIMIGSWHTDKNNTFTEKYCNENGFCYSRPKNVGDKIPSSSSHPNTKGHYQLGKYIAESMCKHWGRSKFE